jgi:hypothetical protein
MDFPEYLTMDLNISYTVKQHHMVSFSLHENQGLTLD